MARTITFDPTPELSNFVKGLVESGTYNNQSEVLREGLRLLQEKKAKSKLQELKKLIEVGENSGNVNHWSATDFLSRAKLK